MSDAVITSQDMYDLLTKIDHKLTAGLTVQANHTVLLGDHEQRLRLVESQEKLDIRMGELTKDVAELAQQMGTMQKIVWGIPASMLVALAAVAVAVLRSV